MTDNYELVGSIRRDLTTIRQYWSELLDPPRSGAKGRGSGVATRGVPAHDPEADPLGLMVADDHLPTELDIDRETRIVSLRREVTDVLNAMSRWVMEERPVTEALPDGLSALSMSLFLDRHAEWIADEDDGYEAERLTTLANRVRSFAAPTKREWHNLGDCPFVTEDGSFCHGRVRVRIGGDQTEGACSKCGQVGPVDWWEEVLGIEEAAQVVNAEGMARVLHRKLGLSVTERTVRNWARERRITAFVPFGPEPQRPRWLFQVRAVLDEVSRMDRECPMCGRAWSGRGDVCSRCYGAIQSSGPREASPRLDWAIGAAPARAISRRLPKPVGERLCQWSDLPLNQCACGRIHQLA